MALRVLNNEQGTISPKKTAGPSSKPVWDAKQREDESFSKICFIPSLGLSCFGCCGHHFADKEMMHQFFDENKESLALYKKNGKSYKEFMERETLLDSCGGCYSLVRDIDSEGRSQYVCGVHPLRVGGEDVRPGYCDHDYLCHTAGLVNRMTEKEKALFYEFLKEKIEQGLDSFEYSMINAQETVLITQYDEWKERRETRAKKTA